MLRSVFHFLCGLVLVAAMPLAGVLFAAEPAAAPATAKPLPPFLQDHCSSCHAAGIRKGGLDLVRLGTDLNDPELLRRWVRIHDRIASGEMPPQTEPRPDRDAARKYLATLADSLTQADARRRQAVLRRLNRV